MTDVEAISAGISALSLAVSVFAFNLSRAVDRSAKRPIPVFEFHSEGLWKIRNIGSGAAINVQVCFRGKSSGWTEQISIPALHAGGVFELYFLGDLDVWMLSAVYSDIDDRTYSTISQHDMNWFRKGDKRSNYLAKDRDYKEGGNMRYWDAPDFSKEESLT